MGPAWPHLARFAAGLGLIALGPGLSACRADGLTHWPVPVPPVPSARQPLLWVALAAHLGPRTAAAAATTAPLVLEGASAPVQLLDAAGQRATGQRLSLQWRAMPLAEPLRLQRLVAGPFPSFESADQVAAAWRLQGVTPVIAHPGDWEVWAPLGSPAPSGQALRRVTITATHRIALQLPAGPGRAAVLLKGPIQIQAPGGLRWRNGVYAGPLRLQSDAYGSWTLVEQVPLERYLQGVVPHEIGAGAPAAALAAQAVLARTWALRNQHRFAVDGYHLCADTQCQVYGDPRQASAPVRQAIQATQGRVLRWQGQPIHAVYHASNGGMAAGFEESWGGAPLPYLRAFPDGPASYAAAYPVPLRSANGLASLLRSGGQAYGADHPLFRWQRSLDRAQISRALGASAAGLGELSQVRVIERGPSGRALALAFQGSKGQLVLRRDAIRRSLRQLPSTLFSVAPAAPGVWRFEGGGFGHGAGLSQAGAMDLARRGWSLQKILSHYYPGTTLEPWGSLSKGL